MEIEEAKNKLKELQIKTEAYFKEFEEMTGCSIDSVQLVSFVGGSSANSKVSSVTIGVKL